MPHTREPAHSESSSQSPSPSPQKYGEGERPISVQQSSLPVVCQVLSDLGSHDEPMLGVKQTSVGESVYHEVNSKKIPSLGPDESLYEISMIQTQQKMFSGGFCSTMAKTSALDCLRSLVRA